MFIDTRCHRERGRGKLQILTKHNFCLEESYSSVGKRDIMLLNKEAGGEWGGRKR